MELKQLQYFRAVAKRRSISLAAEDLYVTQPALSRCIKRLEEEVGTPLLERKSNGVVLSAAGEALLIEVDQMFLHLEQGLSNARLVASQARPTLAVVCSFEGFDDNIVFQVHTFFPDIRTSIDILPPDQAYRELLAGKADFAMIPRIPDRTGVAYRHLLREEMLVSFGDSHPLYGKQTVTLEQLNNQSLICNETSYDWQTIEEICKQNRISMNLLFTGNDHQTVARFRQLWNSIVFLPISTVMAFFAENPNAAMPARCIPQIFWRDIYVAWPEGKRLSSAEKHFLELLQKSYQGLQEQIQAFSDRVFETS